MSSTDDPPAFSLINLFKRDSFCCLSLKRASRISSISLGIDAIVGRDRRAVAMATGKVAVMTILMTMVMEMEMEMV